MKKELILVGAFPPPYGGVATFTENLHQLLVDEGYQVVVLASGKSFHTNDQIIKLNSNFYSLLSKFRYFSSEKVCLDSGYFCLEEPFWQMAPIWYMFKIITRFRWIKFIHSGSLPDRYPKFRIHRKIIFKILLSQIDEMIVVNEELKHWFIAKMNFRKPIHVISSYLANTKVATQELEVPKTVQEFMRTHNKIVCSVGLFTETYGFDQIARVIEKFRRKRGLDVGLILIDGGVSINSKYKEDILDNRPWIISLREVEHQVVDKIIARSDVFVRGFKYESYGLTRIEAINSGTPVIATDVGETRGMLLFTFGNEEQLLEKLDLVLSSQQPVESGNWIEFYKSFADMNFHKIIGIVEEENEIFK